MSQKPIIQWDECFVNPPKRPKKIGLWIPAEKERAVLEHAKDYFCEFYENRCHQDEDDSNKPRIPRIIHHIWFGNVSNMSKEAKRCVESWKVYHSSWTFQFWTEELVRSAFAAWGAPIRVLDECPNYGEKSDIARYYILNNLGGIYCDVDLECVRELDDAVLNENSMVLGLANVSSVCEIGNAFMACSPFHPFVQRLCEDCSSKEAQLSRLLESASAAFPCQTIARTGPGLVTRIWAQRFRLDERLLLLPPSFFYPVPNDQTKESLISTTEGDIVNDYWKKEETIAIHWWHKSW